MLLQLRFVKLCVKSPNVRTDLWLNELLPACVSLFQNKQLAG